MKRCEACTFDNNSQLNFCELCEMPLHDYTIQEAPDGVSVIGAISIAKEEAPTGRVCPACTFQNKDKAITCEVCEERIGKEDEHNAINTQKGEGVEGFKGSNQATDGCIELLSKCLSDESNSKFRLISPMAHLTQLNAEGAQWACGYRNIQMLCLSLAKVPAYRTLLFNGDGNVPDIWGIQAWIEKAWKAGFDEIGAQDFGNSLVGSSEWIGASECCALLRFFGIRAHLVNFTDKAYLEKIMNGEIAARIGNGFRKVKTVANYDCDLCGLRITGFRFRCTVRDNFDLCEACEQRNPQPYGLTKVRVESHYSAPQACRTPMGSYLSDGAANAARGQGQAYEGGGRLSFVPLDSNQCHTSSTGRLTKIPSRYYDDLSDFIVDGGEEEEEEGKLDAGDDWRDNHQCHEKEDHHVVIDMTLQENEECGGATKRKAGFMSSAGGVVTQMLSWNNPSNPPSPTKRRKIKIKSKDKEYSSKTAKDLLHWLDRYLDTFEGGSLNGAYSNALDAKSASELASNKCPSNIVHPIYLQHEGHSRTIVGLQKGPNKVNLLLFDPAIRGDWLKRNLTSGTNWQRWVKRQLSTFKQGAYEIVYVSGVMGGEEKKRSKVLASKSKDDLLLTEIET